MKPMYLSSETEWLARRRVDPLTLAPPGPQVKTNSKNSNNSNNSNNIVMEKKMETTI